MARSSDRLKNKRRKLKSKLVGLGEVSVIFNGKVYLLINTFFFFVLPRPRYPRSFTVHLVWWGYLLATPG